MGFFTWTKKNRVKKILTFLAIVLVVLFLNKFAQTQIKGSFYFASSPIQKVFWQAGQTVSNWGKAIWNIKTIKSDNDMLEEENSILLGDNIRLKALEEENSILREALGVGLPGDFKISLARVIGKDIAQDYFFIDKGFKNGIREGMPVITSQNVLLGKIDEAYPDSARASLISHDGSAFDAKIPGKEAMGVIKGGGSFRIFLDLITRDKELYAGDLVVTSAQGGIFPEGILVGRVRSITVSDIEPFQRAELDPGFQINKIVYLFVITEF